MERRASLHVGDSEHLFRYKTAHGLYDVFPNFLIWKFGEQGCMQARNFTFIAVALVLAQEGQLECLEGLRLLAFPTYSAAVMGVRLFLSITPMWSFNLLIARDISHWK